MIMIKDHYTIGVDFTLTNLKKQENIPKLKRTIGIHILNFTSIPHSQKYHCKFNLREETEGFAYFDDIELHTIELNKFSEGMSDDYDTLVSKIKNSLDMWLAFLTRYDLLDPAKSPIDENVTKALHVLDTINFSNEEREVYNEKLDWLRLEASALEKIAEDSRAEGEAIGIKKGIKDTAKKLVDQGIDVNVIKSATGLSDSEIAKLKSDK